MVWRDDDDSGWHEAVECAVRADGSSPAYEWLDALRRGASPGDPLYQPPEDPEQVHDYFTLLARLESLGRNGCPGKVDEAKHLEDGVWEIRYGTRRVSYWDTPGDGTYTPKYPVKDVRELPPARRDGSDGWAWPYWRYPRMDAVLRVGPGWHKTGDFAPPEKIVEALDTREEDASHDA